MTVTSCRSRPAPLIVWLVGIGAMVTIGTVFERVRYRKPTRTPPGPGWTASPEIFVDPKTSRVVQVYVEASSGARRYVETGAAAPDPGS